MEEGCEGQGGFGKYEHPEKSSQTQRVVKKKLKSRFIHVRDLYMKVGYALGEKEPT